MSPTSSHSLRLLHKPLAESLNEVRLIRTLKLYAISEKADSINFSTALRDFAVNLDTKPTIYLLRHFVVVSVTTVLSTLVQDVTHLNSIKVSAVRLPVAIRPIVFSIVRQPLVGRSLPILEASLSQSDTPQ
jgi:hypothetical protein